MLIKDVWYVAAHADEIAAGGILGRTIAGERIVFCRRSDGSVFALEDKCPHRRAQLSMGEIVEGSNLRCPYHGITFDGAGLCVNVPGQEKWPSDWRIRTYPVLEKYRCLWVWTGDPGKCGDESSIPDFMELGEPPFESRNGMIPVAGDYRLLVDNLLDATHAEFVHRESFGSSELQAAREVGAEAEKKTEQFDVDMRDDGIDFVFRVNNVRGMPCFAKAYAMRMGKESYAQALDWRMDVRWQPPGLFQYATTTSDPKLDNESGLRMVNLHMLTPETETSTHYFFRCSALNTNDKPAILDFWLKTDMQAFKEDKHIIERQQAVIGERDLFDEQLWAVQGDQMSIKGRRVLAALALGQSGAQSQRAERDIE